MANQALIDCNFPEENDSDYLINDEEWVKRLDSRIIDLPVEIQSDVRSAMIVLESEMKEEGGLEAILRNLQNHRVEQYFRNDSFIILKDTVKREIASFFIASVIRREILRNECDYKSEREKFKERMRSKYNHIFSRELGNSAELTWLFRFERAINLLKEHGMRGKGNKGEDGE